MSNFDIVIISATMAILTIASVNTLLLMGVL